METAWSGRRMARLPRAGETVRWRNPRHARVHWWDESYGPGPFEVVAVVDHAGEGIPDGVVLRTQLGEREVNEVWLALEAGGPPPPGPGVNARRVVVADDDRDTREYLREVVCRLGHHAVVAESGRQVVELCLATDPELVITDVRMPDLRGVDAAVEVNRQRAVPFLLVSGYDDPDCLAGADAHVMGYLRKPVREADLKAGVTLALAAFAQIREAEREAARLRQELEDRKVIERAKGALMKRLRVDEADAYRRLQRKASGANRRLVEVAAEVLRAEEVFAGLGGSETVGGKRE